MKGAKPLMETGRISRIRGAPLFKGGTFNHLLPSLVRLVCNQMDVEDTTDDAKKRFMGDIMMLVFKEMKVSLLPWSTVQEGSDSKWAEWNSFIMVAGSRNESLKSRVCQCPYTLVDDELTIRGSQAGASSQVTDVMETWSLSSLPLTSM